MLLLGTDPNSPPTRLNNINVFIQDILDQGLCIVFNYKFIFDPHTTTTTTTRKKDKTYVYKHAS
tara:strand:+ start:674 stop:865 length:192 start_codon:yes stop_codon:yes gene_type:complete